MIDLGEFGALASDVAQLVGEVEQVLQQQATQNQQQTIETSVLLTVSKLDQIQAAVNDILADTEFIRAAIPIMDNRLGQLIGNPQQSGSPVTLPATPPPAYIAPTSGATANAVWSAVSADQATQFGTIVAALSAYLRIFRDSGAIQGRLSSWVSYNFDPFSLVNNAFTSFPEINAGTILPSHLNTIDWLTNVYGSLSWHDLGDNTYWANVSSPSGNALVYVTMTPGEFLWLRELATGRVPGALIPPIWPGISNATLGAPTAFSGSGFSVAGPMDGVLVALSVVPSPLPYYVYGGMTAYGKLGALTFISDNGDAETQEFLGFTNQVYSPKTMKQAASCEIWCKSGITGTVTPWTVA